MEFALVALEQTSIMLLLVLLGVFCFKTKIIDEELNKKLSDFVLKIVAPAVVFNSFQRDYDPELLKGVLWTILLGVIFFTLCIILSHLVFRPSEKTDHRVERFASIYTNCGFFGLPLAQGLFGADGVLYMTAFMCVFNVLVWTQGAYLMSGRKESMQIKGILTNVVIWASILGVVCFVLNFRLPTVLGDTVGYVSSLNTPLAMIVAGVNIAKLDLKSVLKIPRVYLLCFCRNIAFPLITLGIFLLIPQAPEFAVQVAVAGAACPTAALTTMFAMMFDRDAVYGAGLFGISTIFSVVTIPLIMTICMLAIG